MFAIIGVVAAMCLIMRRRIATSDEEITCLRFADKIEKFIYPLTFRIYEGEKMLFEILAFIIGLIYGYVKPGKEKRWELLKKGILYGIILGIIFGFIGLFIGGLIYSAATAIGMFITVIILVVIFIIGTFIGDILEVAIKK
jgi:predicted permease